MRWYTKWANDSIILLIYIIFALKGSINAYRPDDVQFILDQHQRMRDEAQGKRHVVIFYCEFSSERGPRM